MSSAEIILVTQRCNAVVIDKWDNAEDDKHDDQDKSTTMSMMMMTMIWILIDAIAGAVARRGDLPILDQGRPLLSSSSSSPTSPLKNLNNHLTLTSSSLRRVLWRRVDFMLCHFQ